MEIPRNGVAPSAMLFAWKRICRPLGSCKRAEVCAIPQVRIQAQGFLLFSMKRRFACLGWLAFAAFVFAPAHAATQTVTLSVPGMTCITCPITVKAALSKVQGVSNIEVKYAQREAVVTFDDAKTSIPKLTLATTNAGYPSSIKK